MLKTCDLEFKKNNNGINFNGEKIRIHLRKIKKVSDITTYGNEIILQSTMKVSETQSLLTVNAGTSAGFVLNSLLESESLNTTYYRKKEEMSFEKFR